MSVADRVPEYLCSRSADVILSDIRPTKLKPDALKSINVLLDELLWQVLSTARSLSTEKLKTSLLKVLPTPLGKEALLEAEVELRAYLERDGLKSAASASNPAEDDLKFTLYPAFEVLRNKCEVYSTLNESSENSQNDSQYTSQAIKFSPTTLAPAALYMTAVLESVCERILSNVSRVAARDSSRSTATMSDLFVALCEDDNIFTLFKSMKVYSQIESSAQPPLPRRSKSISRNGHSRTSSRALSPSTELNSHSRSTESSATERRSSSDSSLLSTPVGIATAQATARHSVDETHQKKIVNRSVEKDAYIIGRSESDSNRKRSASVLSDINKRKLPSFDEKSQAVTSVVEDDSSRDFDDLMRSGSTMKVSLTPDRLRTFEVYAKEKNQRNSKTPPSSAGLAIRSAASQPDESFVEDININKIVTSPTGSSHHRSRRVNSISGYDESIIRGPPRKVSLSSSSSPNAQGEKPMSLSNSRTRSTSAAQPTMNYPTLGRKTSLNKINARGISRETHKSNEIHNDVGPEKVNETKGLRLEHLDLYDTPDGDSEEDLPPSKRVSPFTPKSARPAENGIGDLVDFLREGPPSPSVPSTIPSFPTDNKLKTGRLRSIVSKITGGNSSEKLTTKFNGVDAPSQLRKPSLTVSTPTFVPPPLSAKKSLHNLSEAAKAGLLTQQLPLAHSAPPSSGVQTNKTLLHDTIGFTKEKSVLEIAKDVSGAKSNPDLQTRKRKSPEKVQHQEVMNPKINEGRTVDLASLSTASSMGIESNPRNNLGSFREIMSHATTADECRLLFDLYISQNDHRSKEREEPPIAIKNLSGHKDDTYEFAVVEMLL